MHILGRLILNRYYYLPNEKTTSVDLKCRQVYIVICMTLGKLLFLSYISCIGRWVLYHYLGSTSRCLTSWLIGKDSDAGRDWGQEEKGMTEDEMAGWHHWLDGHESEWTPGVGDGQGGLACCDSWGHKESDTTEWLNWTEEAPLNFSISVYKIKLIIIVPII